MALMQMENTRYLSGI